MLECANVGLPEAFQNPMVKNLTKKAVLIYTTLVEVAHEVAFRRGFKARPDQITFFCPAEIVAYALGICRATLYRNLVCLRESGLVDQRGHKTTYKGVIRSDGSLWAVNLKPDKGEKAKLHYDELKCQYRDLADDIENSKTAFAAINRMKQSKDLVKDLVASELIIDWIRFSPINEKEPTLTSNNKEPTLSMTVSNLEGADIASILDLPEVHKNERSESIEYAADECARYLDDLSNINFYRWLLWRALRLYRQDQYVLQAIHTMLLKIHSEKADFHKAGAVFVTGLKGSRWWEPLRQAQPKKLGTSKHSGKGLSKVK